MDWKNRSENLFEFLCDKVLPVARRYLEVAVKQSLGPKKSSVKRVHSTYRAENGAQRKWRSACRQSKKSLWTGPS